MKLYSSNFGMHFVLQLLPVNILGAQISNPNMSKFESKSNYNFPFAVCGNLSLIPPNGVKKNIKKHSSIVQWLYCQILYSQLWVPSIYGCESFWLRLFKPKISLNPHWPSFYLNNANIEQEIKAWFYVKSGLPYSPYLFMDLNH